MKVLETSEQLVSSNVQTSACPDSDAQKKQELGQFLTPGSIAAFMASLFEARLEEIRLLDAGAGAGVLTHEFVKRLCAQAHRPKRITVTAYEIDGRILSALGETLQQCRVKCEHRGIEFSADIKNEDFIEAALGSVSPSFFSEPKTPFNIAILNPPYRKINSDSKTRRLLREAGIETSNLYTGFLALAMRLLCDQGEMVAICPRSFCNGPYFRPFREQFLQAMSLRQIHVFESRSAAFQKDEVLQENIILHAVKSTAKAPSIIISTSNGEPAGEMKGCSCAYHEIVSPRDPELFIHLVTGESDQTVRQKMASFTTSLAQLGLEISTGRVVDFRAKEFLVDEPRADTAPLIYPSHFNGGLVQWPKLGGRKPNAILDVERTEELLVPGAIYVLVKRFTTKEERRRVVACIYDPQHVQAERVGFENHLNYFHAHGRGLPMVVAKGLTAFLNSTLVDVYFRQFNGHTQVNATDLRSLRFPTQAELESLGRKIEKFIPEQHDLDALIEREFFNADNERAGSARRKKEEAASGN